MSVFMEKQTEQTSLFPLDKKNKVKNSPKKNKKKSTKNNTKKAGQLWADLDKKNKDEYREIITNFASLSKAFAQKKKGKNDSVAPIVNYKFQETAFQNCFDAQVEDISNTTFDASVKVKNKGYVVGIKTFDSTSNFQKTAQFKSLAKDFGPYISEIEENGKDARNECDYDRRVKSKDPDERKKARKETKEAILEKNKEIYLELAKAIAQVQNDRYNSAKANLRGFKTEDSQDEKPDKENSNDNIKAVYHVLRTSNKKADPKIRVCEMPYEAIAINDIKIIGCTRPENPQNFFFTAGDYTYKWTTTDSQILTSFEPERVLEEWPVTYIENPYEAFKNLKRKNRDDGTYVESYSWLIGLEPMSGINQCRAFSSDSIDERKKKVEKIKASYSDWLSENDFKKISKDLKNLTEPQKKKIWKTKEEKIATRENLINYLKNLKLKNPENLPENKLNEKKNDLKLKVIKLLYRPNYFEFRIPKSAQFHKKHPRFFTKDDIEYAYKVKSPNSHIDKRTFTLRFIPSGKEIKAYVCQNNGKAIQSAINLKRLGKWVREDIFRLNDNKYEPPKELTEQRMNEIDINGVRLTKRKLSNGEYVIELSFIWIDKDHKPKDYWPSEEKENK